MGKIKAAIESWQFAWVSAATWLRDYSRAVGDLGEDVPLRERAFRLLPEAWLSLAPEASAYAYLLRAWVVVVRWRRLIRYSQTDYIGEFILRHNAKKFGWDNANA